MMLSAGWYNAPSVQCKSKAPGRDRIKAHPGADARPAPCQASRDGVMITGVGCQTVTEKPLLRWTRKGFIAAALTQHSRRRAHNGAAWLRVRYHLAPSGRACEPHEIAMAGGFAWVRPAQVC